MSARTALAAFAVLAGTSACLAQSTISGTDKYGWSENCGYLNFRDAGDPAGAQGVRLHADHLSGNIWGENSGWIRTGSGAGPYTNTTGLDYGVNLDPGTGLLSGYAWAENAGWINFAGGAFATPANPARIDFAARRLRGYAWAENIGWINLDDLTTFVALTCPADFDGDGFITGIDFDLFVQAFEAGEMPADFDGDGFITGIDFDLYVAAYEAGY